MNKAQSSIETIIITTIGLLLITLFIAFVWGQIETNNVVQNQQKALQVVNNLKDEIRDVYFLGPGAVKVVRIEIPELTNIENSLISETYLLLNVAGTDIIANTNVNLVGNWPSDVGLHDLVLTTYTDYVTVYVQLLSASPSSINQTLNQGFSKDVNIVFINVLNENKDYNLIINFNNDFSAVSSELNNTVVSFLPNESKNINFSVSCLNNSSGNYFGSIIFESDFNVQIPISINCVASQALLIIFPKEQVINSNGQATLEEFLVCNNSTANIIISNSEIVGSIREYVLFNFSGIIESNSCKSLELNILDHPQGNFQGTLNITASGLLASANISLVHE